VYISNLPLFSPQASATTGAALRVGAGAVDHPNTVVTDMSAHAREQNPNESRDCWSRQRRLPPARWPRCFVAAPVKSSWSTAPPKPHRRSPPTCAKRNKSFPRGDIASISGNGARAGYVPGASARPIITATARAEGLTIPSAAHGLWAGYRTGVGINPARQTQSSLLAAVREPRPAMLPRLR
jgi:hypothetical protein